MNEGLVSRRYAKALYDHAKELNQEDEFAGRMEKLIEAFQAFPRLKEVLSNPMVAADDKAALLQNAAGHSPEQSYIDFVRLIITNRREKFIPIIALSYLSLYRKLKNIHIIKLTSSDKLPSEALSRIQKSVEAHTLGTVQLDVSTNPSIIGGLIFQWNDLRLDASVSSQLEKIRRQFSKNNQTIV